ncbi:MAG: sulfatase-like hydrolase/transferase [Vicinamibacteria bacterium]
MGKRRAGTPGSGLLVSLACALTAASCGRRAEAPPQPNVLLVTIDTLRADRLGCYGRTTAETPAIDGLARGGLLFRRAYSPVPLTLPAHATMLTGLEPAAHGLLDNGMVARELGAPTLAERLSAAGYDSAAFVAAHVLNRVFGLDRGFAVYDDGPAEAEGGDGFFHGVADARGRVDAALEWLRRPRPGRFFLWVHLYDVHAPHVAPEGFGARFADVYDGEVAYVDSQVARLLRALDTMGVAGRTLVVVTADHGEALGEHGEQTHGILLHDATLHVPLVLRLPDRVPAGVVSDRQVGLADLAPTVLGLAGLAPNERAHGVSLLSDPKTERPLWAASEYPARQYGWARLRALRSGGQKYVEAPRPELYDLARDPGELRNLAAERADEAARWSARLREVERGLAEQATGQAPAEADAETRERLAALGYGGVAVAAPPPASGLEDPKDRVAEIGRIERAFEALERGDTGSARALFEEAVARFPGSRSAWTGLGQTAAAAGDARTAEKHLLRALAIDPSRAETLLRLAALAEARGDRETEIRHRRRLVELFPRHAASRRRLAGALEGAGRPAEAEAALREGLALEADPRATQRVLARFLIARGRSEEARALVEELRRADASDPEVEALTRALAAGPVAR